MSFIWDAIAGCSVPGLNIITALLFFFSHLLASVLTLILVLLNKFLSVTILNTGGVNTARVDLFGSGPVGAVGGLYLSMAGLGLIIVSVAVVWAVVHHQEAVLTGSRSETLHGLLGRAAGAVVWIMAVPVAMWALIQVNDALVNWIVQKMTYSIPATFGASCTAGAAAGHAIASIGTSLVAVALTDLLGPVVGLALAVGIIVAIAQYFLRLFQIVFWGALLPLAAGASVADPQRRAWTYVWGQVQGSIFTQSAMAIGIYITERVLVGSNSSNILLSYMMGAAGFFLVSKIPRYFQEMQGHTVGGGSEMGAIAGGYIMGRFGSQALQATQAGVFMNQALDTQREKSTQGLSSGTGVVASGYQRLRSRGMAMRGANEVNHVQAEVTSGLTEAQEAAAGVRAQGQMDGLAALPASRAAQAAERALRNDPTTPLNPHAPPGMGGVAVGSTPARGPSESPAPPTDPPGVLVTGPPGGFVATEEASGTPDPAGVRPPSSSAGARSSAPGSPAPLYGPGSHSAVGQSAEDFARSMVPVAQTILRGNVMTASRGQAAARGMAPTRHDQLMANPDSATPRERFVHAAVLARATNLQEWDQQLALDPVGTVAQLMQVPPEMMSNPQQQVSIEQAMHAAIQNRQSPVRGAFFQPVALNKDGDWSISAG